jgi:hypothetical protein
VPEIRDLIAEGRRRAAARILAGIYPDGAPGARNSATC